MAAEIHCQKINKLDREHTISIEPPDRKRKAIYHYSPRIVLFYILEVATLYKNNNSTIILLEEKQASPSPVGLMILQVISTPIISRCPAFSASTGRAPCPGGPPSNAQSLRFAAAWCSASRWTSASRIHGTPRLPPVIIRFGWWDMICFLISHPFGGTPIDENPLKSVLELRVPPNHPFFLMGFSMC